jgi:hypothetical protein
MVRLATQSLLAGASGGLVAAILLMLPGANPSVDAEAERLAHSYADVLVRELGTDVIALRAASDSLVSELALARLWIDWIDERQVAPSHTLMQAAQNLADPVGLELRTRVIGELERRGHWSAVPDPALREDLVRYHALVTRFDEAGESELRDFRGHLAAVLEPAEWSWMFRVEAESSGFVSFRDNVRLFANDEFRARVRLLAMALQARGELVDEMMSLNEALQSRARAWRDGE